MISILAECMSSDLLKEQDLRAKTPQRWRNEQLIALTTVVLLLPLE